MLSRSVKSFKYWQNRIFGAIFFGYAGFYLIRNVFSYAIPLLQKEFKYTNSDIGLIISLGALVHAFGKGIAGVVSDKVNARYFMAIGLLGSTLMILSMSFSKSFLSLSIFYVFHQIFQSMGATPCAKLLTNWFSKNELGTRWALWNASQQVGSLLMYFFIAFTFWMFSKNWHFIFFVPGFFVLFIVLLLFIFLRDTPESLGFEPVHTGMPKEDHKEQDWALLKKLVYKNPLVIYVCTANFFYYFVRMSLVNWAPKFLIEFKKVGTLATITNPAAKDVAGIIGGVLAGYISDKLFKGERGIVSTVYMILVTLFIFILWQMPIHHPQLQLIVMFAIGFFLSGPQILIGLSATDYSGKKVAGAATGLNGFFGYAGNTLTGIGVGWLLDYFGWDSVFMVICMSGLLASGFLILAWYKRSLNQRRVGY